MSIPLTASKRLHTSTVHTFKKLLMNIKDAKQTANAALLLGTTYRQGVYKLPTSIQLEERWLTRRARDPVRRALETQKLTR